MRWTCYEIFTGGAWNVVCQGVDIVTGFSLEATRLTVLTTPLRLSSEIAESPSWSSGKQLCWLVCLSFVPDKVPQGRNTSIKYRYSNCNCDNVALPFVKQHTGIQPVACQLSSYTKPCAKLCFRLIGFVGGLPQDQLKVKREKYCYHNNQAIRLWASRFQILTDYFKMATCSYVPVRKDIAPQTVPCLEATADFLSKMNPQWANKQHRPSMRRKCLRQWGILISHDVEFLLVVRKKDKQAPGIAPPHWQDTKPTVNPEYYWFRMH